MCVRRHRGGGGVGVSDLDKFHKTYRMVAAQVGVQLAPLTDKEKAFESCQEGTVLGVKYNLVDWTWEILQEKLVWFAVQLRAALSADVLSQSEVWSVASRVMHYAPLIHCGRFNLDHVIRVNGLSKDRNFLVPVSSDLKQQLWFWYTMVLATSGLTRIPSVGDVLPPWMRECYSDAAGGTLSNVGRGVGVVSQQWWAYVPWPHKINCGVKRLMARS
jgi:hypothetical protein